MPILTTAAITLLTTLATKGLEKAFETGGEKISEGAINWIKSLFFKNDSPSEVMTSIQQSPDNPDNLKRALQIIEESINANPSNKKYYDEVMNRVQNTITINNVNKNINTGDVNTGGGNFRIGDDNAG
ncbi:MAG: hypothetical protein JNM95_05265 [Chitinophagaceae bacterium]|nr:hypothetical protein [Chitinophagaceae bacterium]